MGRVELRRELMLNRRRLDECRIDLERRAHLMQRARDLGLSLAWIADVTGLSKPRVWRILHDLEDAVTPR